MKPLFILLGGVIFAIDKTVDIISHLHVKNNQTLLIGFIALIITSLLVIILAYYHHIKIKIRLYKERKKIKKNQEFHNSFNTCNKENQLRFITDNDITLQPHKPINDEAEEVFAETNLRAFIKVQININKKKLEHQLIVSVWIF